MAYVYKADEKNLYLEDKIDVYEAKEGCFVNN